MTQLEIITRYAGNASREIRNLREQIFGFESDLKRFDGRVEVQTVVTGMEAARGDLDSLPSEVEATVDVVTRGVEEARGEIDSLPDSTESVVDVVANGVEDVKGELAGLPDSADVAVQVDDNGSASDVKSEVDSIPRSKTVDVEADDNGTIQALKGQLEELTDIDLSDIGGRFGDLASDISGVNLPIDGLITKLGPAGALAGAALGGAAVISAGINEAINAYAPLEEAAGRVKRELDLTAGEVRDIKEAAQEVAGENFFTDSSEAISAVAFLREQIQGVTDEDLPNMVAATEATADTYEQDFKDIALAAETIVKNFEGLTYPEALNLIIEGFQRGLNKSDDLLETINEYSPQFNGAREDLERMFAVMETGNANGMLGTDKVADAYKEFGLKLIAGDESVLSALEKLGLSNDDLVTKVQTGAMTQGEAFDIVIGRLKDVDFAIADTIIKGGELGTPFEDMGTAAVRNVEVVTGALSNIEGNIEGVVGGYQSIIDKQGTLESKIANIKEDFGEMFIPLKHAAYDTAIPALTDIETRVDNIGDALFNVSQSEGAEKFLRWVDVIAEINNASGGFGDSDMFVDFIEGLDGVSQKVNDFLGMEYETPAFNQMLIDARQEAEQLALVVSSPAEFAILDPTQVNDANLKLIGVRETAESLGDTDATVGVSADVENADAAIDETERKVRELTDSQFKLQIRINNNEVSEAIGGLEEELYGITNSDYVTQIQLSTELFDEPLAVANEDLRILVDGDYVPVLGMDKSEFDALRLEAETDLFTFVNGVYVPVLDLDNSAYDENIVQARSDIFQLVNDQYVIHLDGEQAALQEELRQAEVDANHAARERILNMGADVSQALAGIAEVNRQADYATRPRHITITSDGVYDGSGNVITAHDGANFSRGQAMIVGDDSYGRFVPGYTEALVAASSGMVVASSNLQTALNLVGNNGNRGRSAEPSVTNIYNNATVNVPGGGRDVARNAQRGVERAFMGMGK